VSARPASEAFDHLKLGLAQSHPNRRPPSSPPLETAHSEPPGHPFRLYLKCEACGEKRTLADPYAPWICLKNPARHCVRVSDRVIP
jgi:hypothetical protein